LGTRSIGASSREVASQIELLHKFYDETWDLRHLDAFALRLDPELGFEIDVVVLFTCHCFAHSMKWDERAPTEIPPEEIFDNGIERRVLDKERYELSRRFMPQLVKALDQRQIRFAGIDATNFHCSSLPTGSIG
jgi:hypothetical protein